MESRAEGAWVLDLSATYLRRDRIIDDDPGGPRNDLPNPMRFVSHQWLLTADIAYTFADGWDLHALLTHIDVRLRAEDSSRTLRGPGDTRLGLRHTWSASAGEDPAWTFWAEAGIRVPTGRPKRPEIMEAVPSTALQTGTGTWDPFFGLGMNRRLGRADLFATVDALLPLMENRYEFRAGAAVNLSLGGRLPINQVFSIQPALTYTWRDVDRVDERRLFASGGHWLWAQAAVQVGLTDATSVWIGARVPLWRDLVTPTLEADAQWTAGISISW